MTQIADIRLTLGSVEENRVLRVIANINTLTDDDGNIERIEARVTLSEWDNAVHHRYTLIKHWEHESHDFDALMTMAKAEINSMTVDALATL